MAAGSLYRDDRRESQFNPTNNFTSTISPVINVQSSVNGYDAALTPGQAKIQSETISLYGPLYGALGGGAVGSAMGLSPTYSGACGAITWVSKKYLADFFGFNPTSIEAHIAATGLGAVAMGLLATASPMAQPSALGLILIAGAGCVSGDAALW